MCCFVASIVLLGPAAALAVAEAGSEATDITREEHVTEEPLADKTAVVSPQAVVEETNEEVPSLAEAVDQAQNKAVKTGKVIDPADVVVPGSAASQNAASKKLEAKEDCRRASAHRTSKMLGTAGVVVSDDDGIWGTVLLLVAALAALLLIVTIIVKGATAPKDRLQLLATVIAIASGVVGYGHTLAPTGEIGAATGIAFLGDGTLQAAAEPERRGGGNAQVTTP